MTDESWVYEEAHERTTLEEIKTASKEELNKITKNYFLKCFEDWKKKLELVYNICWGLKNRYS